MASRFFRSCAVTALALAVCATGAITGAEGPLAIDSGRVTIAGTSNVHAYTASTTNARVTRSRFGLAIIGADVWADPLKPGVVEAFEITVAAGTLTSPREGLDRNMHKALKVQEFPEITFRLSRFDVNESAPGTAKARGVLCIAGGPTTTTSLASCQASREAPCSRERPATLS